MNRVRRGKDFKVLWSFFDYNGEPYQLDKTFLTLYVSNSFDRFEVTDFSVEENTITWIFRGKDQKALGDYTLELIQNNGTEGMIPIDSVDAFTLVQYSRDESLCGGGNVKIEDVTVNSTLDIETISSLIDAQLSETSMNPVQNKVITAALNTKADKSSVPTKTSQLTNDSGFITAEEAPVPDWNASTYKEGHIKNRTHHMQDYMCQYFNGSPIKISKPSDTGYVLLVYDTDLPEKFIRIEIKANESKTEEFLDAMGMPLIFTWDAGNSTINVQSFGGAIETYGMRAYYSSSAKGYDDYFVALDEGFIPEEVARKRELKTINGQSLIGEGNININGGGGAGTLDSESVASTEATEEFPQVLYTEQTLTDAQKAQARKNIGINTNAEGSYDDTELREQITELSAEIDEVVGGETIVYDEIKVQTIRYMKIEHPFVKGQILEITLTENAATMSQGINIYRVVSASAMYKIGHFDAVGQTINVVLEEDAPQGLQFENLDANTTYGVRVVAINRTEGRLNVVEQQISNLSENVEGFSESANKIDSITEETKSINLFDKTNLVVGYIQEGNGTIYASTTSSCSALIPIQGGHYYLLSGRDNIGTTGIRCLDADGNIMKVLIASTDAELSTFACPNERGTGAATNGQFKTPNNAVYVQFTAVFSGKGSVDNIMLTDLGITYSANPSAPNYEPYGTTILVKYGAVPNPLLGKSVIFTGDSICNASSDYANGGGWAKRIGEKNGMTWVNRGISGGTITSKEAIGGYFTISETDFGNGADYIILEGGTNDADRIGSILNGEKPAAFGSWTIGDYTSEFTNDTFCGALEMMLKKVITDFPSAKVGFIIAMKMGQTGQGYTAEKYNRRAYFETIIQICHKWGVPVLNLWDNCTMNPKIPTHTELYTDGQHPTGKGYDFITPIIEAWMKTL